MKRIIEIICIIIALIFSVIFLLSLIPNFEITKEILRNVGLVNTLGLTFILILRLFRIIRINKINIIGLLSFFLIVGVMIHNIFWEEEWVTQRILFRHGHLSNRTIEIQTKNHKTEQNEKRIIERTKYLNIIQKVNEVDTINIELPWIREDEIKNKNNK